MRRFWWLSIVVGFAVACGGRSVRRIGDADDGAENGGVAGTGPAFGGSSPTANGGFSTGGTFFDGGTGGTSGTGFSGTGGTGFSGTGGTISIGGFGGTSTSTGAQPNGGGLPIDPPGPQRCGGVVCEAPLVCCLSNSTCYDPATQQQACPYPPYTPDGEDAPPCASNNHCNPDQYCQLPLGSTCQGTGHCQSRINCPASGYQVCGCDGNSHAGVEAACHAGVNAPFLATAACGQTIDANGGEFRPPRWITICGSDAHCGPGERCCDLSRVCYPVDDPGRCQVPPVDTRYPCTADDQCLPEYEYCAGSGCGTPGGCKNRFNEECGVRLELVCGCNGVTYTSAACAEQDGMRVSHGDQCGVDKAPSQ